MNDARQIGQRRYAKVVEHAAREMAAAAVNGNGNANGHA